MSTELMKPLADFTGSYSTTITKGNGWITIASRNWISDFNYIEINPTGNTYYYDIIYSNTSGAELYVGFEKYDANKTATSNNSCVYVLDTTAAATDKRIYGTVDLSKDALGSTTKYIKLRILTDWYSYSSSSQAGFKLVSLRQSSSIIIPQLKSNGIVTYDAMREGEKFAIYKNGYLEEKSFIEY